VKFFPLTYDRLQLIEDDPTGEPPSADSNGGGARDPALDRTRPAALVSDNIGPSSSRDDVDDNTALEPATVARAIE